MPSVAARVDALDWARIEQDLWTRGYAETPPVLMPAECRELVEMYDDDRRFRHRVDMARHRFGLGDYKYFARPLPEIVESLRTLSYPHLAEIANAWNAALGIELRYPAALDAFLERCAARGQTKPTPLLLHYERGG